MRVAVLQSNFLPWKGYFDLIDSVDCFVFHDDLQYTKGDWRNRNQIIGPNGLTWLTIPVGTDEKRLICEVEFTDCGWFKKHRNLVFEYYRRAPHFEFGCQVLEEIYAEPPRTLSDFNQRAIISLSRRLGISTVFLDSRSFAPKGAKTERLIDLLNKVGATSYVSGPSGKNYIQKHSFEEAGIQLEWFNYGPYAEYPQLHTKFQHQVSIIDLFFNLGDEARKYFRSQPRSGLTLPSRDTRNDINWSLPHGIQNSPQVLSDNPQRQ